MTQSISIELPFFQTLIVEDLQALRDTPATNRKDEEVRVIKDLAVPPYNLKNVPYIYDPISTATEQLPAIVVPTDNIGRWIQMVEPFIIETVIISAPPPYPDMRWIANVGTVGSASDPERTLIWRSVDPFPDTPTITDWIPLEKPIDIDGIPANTFNADWENQLIRDINTDIIYKAINQTGKWAIESVEFIKGTDVVGDYAVIEDQHKLSRTLTANSQITLNSGLEKDLEIRLIRAGFNLTLKSDGTSTINGGTSDVIVTDAAITVYNEGNNYYIL